MCGVSIADLGASKTSCCVRLKTRHFVRVWRLIERRRGRGRKERRGRRRRGSDRERKRGRRGREKRCDLFHVLSAPKHTVLHLSVVFYFPTIVHMYHQLLCMVYFSRSWQ